MQRLIANIAVATVAVSALLIPATQASAAELPTGTATYGANTWCIMPDGVDNETENAECDALPSGLQWAQNGQNVPTSTATPTNASLSADYVSNIVPEGGVVSGGDGAYGRAFIVNPTVGTLPLLGQLNINVFGHNPDDVTINNVRTVFVADLGALGDADPFYNEAGSNIPVTTSGVSSVELPVSGSVDAGFTASLELPTPTYVHETSGDVAGYGYAGYIHIVVEGTRGGESFTQVQTYIVNLASAFMSNIELFQVDPCAPGTICNAGNGYAILGTIGAKDSQVVTPEPEPTPTPTPTPTPVEPEPTPEPPVVEPTPTPTPTPVEDEPTPVDAPPSVDGPRVNTGADSSGSPLAALLPGLGVLAVLGMLVPVLRIARKREEADASE